MGKALLETLSTLILKGELAVPCLARGAFNGAYETAYSYPVAICIDCN